MSEDGMESQVDVKQTLAYRGLKAAVIILGVLIVAALVILVVGFAAKMGHHSDRASVAFTPAAGASLVSVEAAGDRLVLRLHSKSGDEVDIVDAQDGHLVARFKFAP